MFRDRHVTLVGPIRMILKILMEWIHKDSHSFLLEFHEKWLEVAKFHLGNPREATLTWHCRRKSGQTETVFGTLLSHSIGHSLMLSCPGPLKCHESVSSL